jgi:1-acyl-sn-glycerol-3-phosphate acyltransferase
MLRWLFKLLFRKNGWKVDNPFMKECQHCVMVGAPHTSNWDFPYLIAAFELMHIPLRFTIKKEWMGFPFGMFLRPLGAIPIDRKPRNGTLQKRSVVDSMVDIIQHHYPVTIVVTPEGTRKKVKKWKSGFYRVAVGAGVPIALGYLDYKRKVAGVGRMIYPSGDFRKDMEEIVEFYKTVTPRFPELNSVQQPGFTIE